MSNTITASRALTTFKSLNNGISVQINQSKFCFVKKAGKNIENGKSESESIEDVNKNFQSIQDKLEEMFKLRQGLNAVNYNTIIKVNGKEMSILDALSYKHHIIPHKKYLLENLKKEQRRQYEKYQQELQNYEKRINDVANNEAMVAAIKLEEPSIHDISSRIELLQKEIEAFELDFDIYLNEVNPTISFNM